MSDKDKKKRKEHGPKPWKYVLTFVVFAILIFVGWLLYMDLFEFFFGSRDLPDSGQLGDTYGSLNTLFSGLAFAALVVTLVLQSKELAAQREELEDTREVLKLQTKEFKASAEMAKKQVEVMEKTRQLQAQPFPIISDFLFDCGAFNIKSEANGKYNITGTSSLEFRLDNPTDFPAVNVYFHLDFLNLFHRSGFMDAVLRLPPSEDSPRNVLIREDMSHPLNWLPNFDGLNEVRIRMRIFYKNILGAKFMYDAEYHSPIHDYYDPGRKGRLGDFIKALEVVQPELDRYNQVDSPKEEFPIGVAQTKLNDSLGGREKAKYLFRCEYFSGCLRQKVRIATPEDITFFRNSFPNFEL